MIRHAETADSLLLAMLVLLESLSPEQRAVLLLHEVFDYSYPEVAAILGKREANVRELATRARRHLNQPRPRFQTTREQRAVRSARGGGQMSTAQTTSNEATLRRFQDAINTGDIEFISKTIDEVVEPDVVIRTPLPVGATGAQALKEGFGRLHRAFPDLHIKVEDVIAEGDKVVARNTVTGTHQGEYIGLPPTGKSVTYNEIFIFRFVNGRIAETWGVGDVFSQLRQLGTIRGGFS
jgi:steroid delta-isomerase-like uncharacterized protein